MLNLNAQWGVTAPLEASDWGFIQIWESLIPLTPDHYSTCGPKFSGNWSTSTRYRWTSFPGIVWSPRPKFLPDQNFYDRPLFHTQTTIFLHQIIIPSWQLTVSMHEIGSLICNQHDKLMVKMTILFLLWWNFQNFCQTKISVTENRKLLGTAFTCIATLSPCLQQNLLVILELALWIHRMVHSSPSGLCQSRFANFDQQFTKGHAVCCI